MEEETPKQKKVTAINLVSIVRALEKNKDGSKEIVQPLINAYNCATEDIREYLEKMENTQCYAKARGQFERLKARGKDAISMHQRLYQVI